MYKIVTTPNKLLLEKARDVDNFDKKLQTIIDGMELALRATKDPIGVGLAAPQVGLGFRIFQMKPTEKSIVTTYINPVITNLSEDNNEYLSQSGRKKKAIDEGRIPPPEGNKLLEGCLSIPNIWGYVQRKKELTLSWQDESGNKFTKHFTGFPAIIIQHEMDHLNGFLFTKRVIEQNEKLFKSHKNSAGEDEFEEIKI